MTVYFAGLVETVEFSARVSAFSILAAVRLTVFWAAAARLPLLAAPAAKRALNLSTRPSMSRMRSSPV